MFAPRRWFSSLVFLVCLVGTNLAATRPNFIIFLCDDLRYDAVGFMGNRIVQTPNLDKLAAESVVFENAFAVTSICWTSRANILFGQYGSTNRVEERGNLHRRTLTPEELSRTYLGILRQAGYYVGYVGKWNVGRVPNGFFDYNGAFEGQGRYWTVQDGRPVHLTNLLTERALEFLRSAPADRPFCLVIGYKSPHVQDGFRNEPYPHLPDLAGLYETTWMPAPRLSSPHFFASQPRFIQESMGRVRWSYRLGPPESLNYQRSLRRYYRMVTGIDRSVRRVLDGLRQVGRADRTAVLFTSDQGLFLGERGLAGKWLGHDASIRIPFLFYWPDAPKSVRGSRRKELVLTIDIAPTLLSLAGVSPPSEMQGESLVPLLETNKPVSWREEFFYEYRGRIATIPRSIGVRTRRYKYLRYFAERPVYEELYDLEEDPFEANNLAYDPEHRALLVEMRARCAYWDRLVRGAGVRE